MPLIQHSCTDIDDDTKGLWFKNSTMSHDYYSRGIMASRLFCSWQPEAFIDTALLKELDKSGFIDALYKE